MYEINQHLLNRLRRDILSGRRMDDLSVSIESRDVIESGSEAECQPETGNAPAHGRKPPVCYPVDKMLCNIHSHSPHDFWTVKYRGQVMARGEFSELSGMLTLIPRQVLSYRYMLTRQVIIWIGLISILVLSFVAGITSGRNVPPAVMGKISNIESHALTFTTGVTNVKTSLDEIVKRQDTMQALLVSAFTQLKSTKEVPLPAGRHATGIRHEEESVSAKVQKGLAQQDVNLLLELENRKKELRYNELELVNRGLLINHPERESLSKNIKSLEQQILEIKEKYGLLNQ